MIDNDSLRQAFGALERHAPAEPDVLAGLHKGIGQRRRRRQIASIAGVATTASLVALGVVLVAPGQPDDQVGSPPATAPPSTSSPSAPPARPALPFTVGWVPDGYTMDAWSASAAESSVQYVGTKDFQTVVVWISAEPRDPVQGAVDEPATIAGRPGMIRQLGVGPDTQLIWQLADGRWAMVGGMLPTVPLSALHRVAENLSAQPTPLTVPLGLRGLPEGYQVAQWSGGSNFGSVTLCRAALEARADNPPGDCIGVAEQAGTVPATVLQPIAESPADKQNLVEVPLVDKRVVNGVATWVTGDGVLAVAQVDAGHWVQAFSKEAGADLLREAAALSTAQ